MADIPLPCLRGLPEAGQGLATDIAVAERWRDERHHSAPTAKTNCRQQSPAIHSL
jgi:hypothetical protein